METGEKTLDAEQKGQKKLFFIALSFASCAVLLSSIFVLQMTSIVLLHLFVLCISIIVACVGYHALKKNTTFSSKDEVVFFHAEKNYLFRSISLFIISYIFTITLIQLSISLIDQTILFLCFIVFQLGNFRIIKNLSVSTHSRGMYFTELYLMLFSISAFYGLFYQKILSFHIIVIFLSTYFFSYILYYFILFREQFRIYNVYCIQCDFRKRRPRYLLAYAFITSIIFMGLLLIPVSTFFAGITLSIVLHIMRSLTCNNLKHKLNIKTKFMYLFILVIIAVLIAHSIVLSRNPQILPPPDVENSSLHAPHTP